MRVQGLESKAYDYGVLRKEGITPRLRDFAILLFKRCLISIGSTIT